MAQFIDFEADASDLSSGEEALAEIDDPMLDDREDLPNNDCSFFRFFNQVNDSAETLARINEEQKTVVTELEPNNYLEVGEEVDFEIDEQAPTEINESKFEKKLKNRVKEQTKKNSFISALLYAINYQKNKEIVSYSSDELKEKIGPELFNALDSEVENCVLDLDKVNFDNMCLSINDIFIAQGLFLRVYERKQKFHYLFHQTEEKNETIKTLSSCIQIKFNGFKVAAPYLENQKKKGSIPNRYNL